MKQFPRYSNIHPNKQAQNLEVVKTKVWVNFESEMNQRCLALSQRQLKNLKTLKKKILNEFGYEQSQSKKIQLSIMQIYPNQPENIKTPIFNEQNLKLIISFLENYERDIKIQAQKLEGELAQRQIISQEAIQKGQLHFDQNGSLIEENDEMFENIPDNNKYNNSTGHIRCAFCQKNNQDKKYLKRCGGLYGPFEDQKYVHLLCALWCHRVYLDETTNLLMNVDEEIKRAEKKKCRFCGEYGAGLVCDGYRYTKKNKEVKCYKSYHFKCSIDQDCKLSWLTFKMLCKQCKQDQELWELINDHKGQKHKAIEQMPEQGEVEVIKIEDNGGNFFTKGRESCQY